MIDNDSLHKNMMRNEKVTVPDELKSHTIYKKEDLLKIFPFGKTKLNLLLQAGILPVIKIGRDYLTNSHLIRLWFEENAGKELYY